MGGKSARAPELHVLTRKFERDGIVSVEMPAEVATRFEEINYLMERIFALRAEQRYQSWSWFRRVIYEIRLSTPLNWKYMLFMIKNGSLFETQLFYVSVREIIKPPVYRPIGDGMVCVEFVKKSIPAPPENN